MNKPIGIGIAVIAIVLIVGIAYSLSSTESDEKNLSIIEDNDLDNLTAVEKEGISVPEQAGKEFSVELTEKIGLKSP
jgi:hypothetical protein